MKGPIPKSPVLSGNGTSFWFFWGGFLYLQQLLVISPLVETMPSIIIRPALITDISSIVKVGLGAFTKEEVAGFIIEGENPYSSIENLQKVWDQVNLLKDGSEVYVAEHEGKMVGFIVCNMRRDDDNIDNLVVAKEEQGKGIGRLLVRYVEKLAISRGYDVLKTDTTENAEGVPWKAYGFWKRMGYEDNWQRVVLENGLKVIPLVKRLR